MAGPRPGQLSQSGAIPGDAIIATVTNPAWGEGGAPLTPWTENVDAAGYNLINAATITATDGGAPMEAGATLTLRGGTAAMGAGGGVAITARDGSGPGSAGGSITIAAGAGDGGGAAGTVTLSIASTERMRINGLGTTFLGDGTTLTVGFGSAGAASTILHAHRTAASAVVIVDSYNAASATDSAYLILRRSRGTAAVPVVVNSGDVIGGVSFQGATTATDTRTFVDVIAEVDGAVGGVNDSPGRLRILTTPDGSGTPVERMRITSLGTLLMGDGTIGSGYGGTGGSSFPIIAYRDTAGCTNYLMNFTANAGGGAFWQFTRGRGNAAVPAAVSSGDVLGGIQFAGVDSPTAANLAAEIAGVAASASATTGYLRFSTRSASTPAERMRISDSGCTYLGDGTLNLTTFAGTGTIYAIQAYRDTSCIISANTFNDTATTSPTFLLCRSRGTAASPTAVAADDIIGGINWQGIISAAIGAGNFAAIYGTVDGAIGSGDTPGRLTFHTTPDGSGTLVEAMRINNGGNVGIGMTPGQNGESAARVEAAKAAGNYHMKLFATGDASTSGGLFQFVKVRGTFAAPAIVQNGDQLGGFYFQGSTNATGQSSQYATIVAFVDGVPSGSTSAPGRLIFSTTPAGAAFSTERMRINAIGTVFNGDGTISSSIDAGGAEQAFTIYRSGSSCRARTYAFSNTAVEYPDIWLGRYRGTATTAAAVQSGDTLGVVTFCGGYNTVSAFAGGSIAVTTTEAWSGSAAGARMAFNVGASGSQTCPERMRITSNGTVMNGDGTIFSAWASGFTATSVMAYRTNLSNGHNIAVFSDTSTEESILSLARGRGTAAAPTAVTTNYVLGRVQGAGFINASVADPGASIAFVAEGNWAPGVTPARMIFSTATTSGAPVERARIDSLGTLWEGDGTIASAFGVDSGVGVGTYRNAAISMRTYAFSAASAATTSQFLQARGRGTAAVPSAVLSGDRCGQWSILGVSSATGYVPCVYIIGEAAENFSDTTSASRMIIQTGVTGSNVPVERARIDALGTLLLGDGSIANVFGGTPSATTRFNSYLNNTNIHFFQTFNGSAGDAPYLWLVKGRGTPAAPTAALSGDTIGAVAFSGVSSSSATIHCAEISVIATENLAATTNGGGAIRFNTITTGTPTTAERMRIVDATIRFPSGGIVGYSSATNNSAALDTGFSRVSAGVVALGNGSAANATGTLQVAAITAPVALALSATGANDITFTARSGSAIPFSAAAPDNALVGFTATSIIGALNEVRAGTPGLSAHTSNYSLNTTTDLAPKVHTNDGATGTVNMPLPSAAVGLTYMIYVGAAFIFGFTAAAGDTIQFDNAAVSITGGYIRCDGTAVGIGAWLEIRALDSTRWAVTSYTGSWTVEV